MEFNSTDTESTGTQMSTRSAVSNNFTQTTQLQLDCGLPLGQCDVLRTMQQSIQAISIAVLLLAFLCIFILRKYRHFHERIICHLLLADLLNTITIISLDGRPDVEDTPACTAQGYFVQLFGLAELMWLFNLTIFVYLYMAKSKDTSNSEGLYTAIAWLLPPSVACVPLITEDYGLANAPYCWISPSTAGSVYRILLYWGPAVLGVTSMLVVFVYLFWQARKAVRHYQGPEDPFTIEHKRQVKNYLIPLAAYSGAFLVLNVVLSTNRALNAKGVTNFGFLVFHEIAISSYGLIITVLFVLTNGRKEFTKAKFVDGFEYYKKWIRGGDTQGLVKEYEVTSTPSVTPSLGRRNMGLESGEAQDNAAQGNTCLEFI